MKVCLKYLVLILTLFYGITLGQNSKADVIENLISDLYKKNLFNGALVVGQNGKIIFSKGYGYADFQQGSPFTPLTTADGGSNAKTFTATAILLLAEENKLNLDDPVQQYLPNYPYANTTLWNLITHSVGGLPDYDYFFENAPDTAIVSTTLNLAIISKNKPSLAYPPNTNFYYDNVAFDLAALVVERVTGMSYYQFLKENIFRIIGMDSSFVRPALFSNWKSSRTKGYRYRGDTLQVLDIADREGFYGGCNIWFTATDLYHWGESFYRHPPFSTTLFKKITSSVTINNKPSYVRLGAWYAGKSDYAFYYWGNVAGFYSWVYWDSAKKFTIAFMTNTTMPQWVRPQLTSALINIVEGKSYPPIKELQSDSLNLNNLGQVSGVYEVNNLGKVQISVKDSQVILKLNDGMEYRMHLVDRKTFYIPGFDPWISFGLLKNGKFQTIYWSATVLQTTGKRISN